MAGALLALAIRDAVVIAKARAEAKRLNCQPEQLCGAILTLVFGGDMVDAVLDGDRVAELLSSDYRQKQHLGDSQRKILDWLVARLRESGSTELHASYSFIARELGINTRHMPALVRSLRRAGLIDVATSGPRRSTVWTVRGVKGCV